MSDLGFKVQLQGNLTRWKRVLREALLAQGFGILTEIDVKNDIEKEAGCGFSAV